MKLHELVHLRNQLNQILDYNAIFSAIEKNSTYLKSLSADIDATYRNKIIQLADEHYNNLKVFQTDKENIQKVINEVNLEIENLSKKFFDINYQLELFCDDPNHIRNARRITTYNESEVLLQNRINLYSSWQYPALEIGCRDGEWTKFLVASDPLYISDVFDEFINSAKKQFTAEYQARLRTYKIQDNKIINLPKKQFGFIFSYNFFNYLSLDSIKQFLIQSHDWLRSGGVMLFTYNNCDISTAAAYSESFFMTFVPKSILIPLCESLGYEIIVSYDFPPAFSWVEIKKPGILETTKAHQTLGEIRYY